MASQRPKCANLAQAKTNAYETVGNRRVKPDSNLPFISTPSKDLINQVGRNVIAICSEKRNEKKEKWIFRCSKLNEAKVVVKKCKTDFRLDCGESATRTDCGLSQDQILEYVKVCTVSVL